MGELDEAWAAALSEAERKARMRAPPPGDEEEEGGVEQLTPVAPAEESSGEEPQPPKPAKKKSKPSKAEVQEWPIDQLIPWTEEPAAPPQPDKPQE